MDGSVKMERESASAEHAATAKAREVDAELVDLAARGRTLLDTCPPSAPVDAI